MTPTRDLDSVMSHDTRRVLARVETLKRLSAVGFLAGSGLAFWTLWRSRHVALSQPALLAGVAAGLLATGCLSAYFLKIVRDYETVRQLWIGDAVKSGMTREAAEDIWFEEMEA